MKKKVLVGLIACGALLLFAGAAAASGKIGTKYEGDGVQTGPGVVSTDTESSASAEENSTAETDALQTEDNAQGAFVPEENPVRKHGNVVSFDSAAGEVLFESTEYVLQDDGSYEEVKQQIRMHIADGTPVLDAVSGLPVSLEDINTAQPAYAWISQTMAESDPPQTALQLLVVNIPADMAAPQYVVVKKLSTESNGTVVLTDQDGNRWAASEETTEVTPYLTRNIVRLSDVQEGSFCLIWPGEAVGMSEPPLYQAQKIMVFAW